MRRILWFRRDLRVEDNPCKKFISKLQAIEAKNLYNEAYLLHANLENYPKLICEYKIVTKITIESFKNGVYTDVVFLFGHSFNKTPSNKDKIYK